MRLYDSVFDNSRNFAIKSSGRAPGTHSMVVSPPGLNVDAFSPWTSESPMMSKSCSFFSEEPVPFISCFSLTIGDEVILIAAS